MSEGRTWPKSNAPVVGSLTSTPSISTLTWLELVPRMNTEVWPPGPPLCTMLRPGASFSTSGRVVSCLRAMSSAVIRVMLLATSASGVGRRLAVTTTGPRLVEPAGASADWAKAALAAMETDNAVAANNFDIRKNPRAPVRHRAGASAPTRGRTRAGGRSAPDTPHGAAPTALHVAQTDVPCL